MHGFRHQPIRLLLASFLLTVSMCGAAADAARPLGDEWAGGTLTTFESSTYGLGSSAPHLSAAHQTPFFLGRSFFTEKWVPAGTARAPRQGLGPLFVNHSCAACHFRGGRTAPLTTGLELDTMSVRLSLPGTNSHGGPKPDAVYGRQLQTRALPGTRPEAGVMVTYEEIPGHYADGQRFVLRRPKYVLINSAYGVADSNLVISPLAAPALFGLGLLEAVPEETIRDLARSESRNKNGIAGKINWVWDEADQQLKLGRFGWKAEQPSIAQQCAIAFNEDMGLTTHTFAHENGTDAENIPDAFPHRKSPEVGRDLFEAIVVYCHTLPVPGRRNWTDADVLRGQHLFNALDCGACHVPTLRSGTLSGYPELSGQTIHPYTDLLLHDMGDGLADQRSVFQANGRQWRTPPLWGLGLIPMLNGHTFFLHDGRARNLAEAILAHGGEAQKAREQFRQLNQTDRAAMVAFLNSI